MPQDEREWLAAAQKGDTEAFSKLVELYQQPVYNMCYRMLGNAQAAEDAAQEAFIRAFKAMPRFDLERKFISWLLSIAANYCIDQRRKRRVDKVPLDNVAPAELSGKGAGVEGGMIEREMQDDVQALLDALSAEDRAAVMMHYWYDYSYKEIAAALDISVAAVKSRLHRARKSLAETWQTNQDQMLLAARRQHESTMV